MGCAFSLPEELMAMEEVILKSKASNGRKLKIKHRNESNSSGISSLEEEPHQHVVKLSSSLKTERPPRPERKQSRKSRAIKEEKTYVRYETCDEIILEIHPQNEEKSQQNDNNEAPQKAEEKTQESSDSCGYYSQRGSACSSPAPKTDTNSVVGHERPTTPTGCDLEMEMFMMMHTEGVMRKTSSPILERRATKQEASENPSKSSNSYDNWAKVLEKGAAAHVVDVTHIPEAIAGQFCPKQFPAFTELHTINRPSPPMPPKPSKLKSKPIYEAPTANIEVNEENMRACFEAYMYATLMQKMRCTAV